MSRPGRNRRDGPGCLHLHAAAAIVLIGCAAPVQVAFDERADFAQMRTWDFEASAGRSAPSVDAPEGSAPQLEAKLVRLVEEAFRSRGYRRDTASPDLRVACRLSLERRLELVDVPRAARLVPSLSYSPSYWVEGSETQQRVVDDLRLLIEAADRNGRVVWKGGVRRRGEEHRRPDLREAVAELLERFPRAGAPPRPILPAERVALRDLREADRAGSARARR